MTAKPPRLAAPSVLLTDLYQLTMLQGYFERGMTETAVFEFFARELPACRHFYLAAGLEQALDYLEQLRFSPAELAWLATQRMFKPAFLDYLAALRFTGDVHAMPEGTPFFADEPILRVTAPLPEAQLVESRLINLLHFQTLVASKAARIVLQAPGKRLVDFGLRRSHGAEAGLFAARASYLAGFSATATVLAGAQFGIPLAGTMAHSFVQAHADEREAFAHFAESLPQSVVLLIDTYDTEAGAASVVELAPQLAARGLAVHGVRLDSGDLGAHARRVRAILDAGGLGRVTLFASGSVDEYLIRDLLAQGAPIDGFGVGTRLDTSSDAPALDCAYKLQEYAGRPCRKRSEGKATWPGRKQVYRRYDEAGCCQGDTLALEAEVADGAPLLEQVMHQGQRLRPSPGLDEVRRYTRAQLASLPPALRGLDPAPPYAVRISAAIRALAAEADRLSAGL
ncbi:nicotinate phosphoribosyltransferase [Stutzerimonas balearica]|uniref:nicotinate phosphoribosyltransferase n=1 Tax=Stutzerimonas balearica TaxID=74829 RepID=UPI0013F3FA02|nr:nicotinate phosphoribosyltransferase [Stutzerimonas balearica]QIJ02389.1 nicotinate phosphoribosyltransferase [Stutzerimonas balearica]